MAENDPRILLEGRLATSIRQLTNASIRRICELADRYQLSDQETHVLVTTMAKGTTSASRSAADTGTTPVRALEFLHALQERDLINPATGSAPEPDTGWHLTANGKAEAQRVLRPSTYDAKKPRGFLLEPATHEAIAAVRHWLRLPPPPVDQQRQQTTKNN